jgi:hypothetical protein
VEERVRTGAFVELGFPAEQLAMVDIIPERIESKRRFPALDIDAGAQQLTWSDGAFDVVMEELAFSNYMTEWRKILLWRCYGFINLAVFCSGRLAL